MIAKTAEGFSMKEVIPRTDEIGKKNEKARISILMTQTLCIQFWSNIERTAKILLSAMFKGDEKRMMFSALRKMLKGYELPNLIEINREIAQIVKEKGATLEI